MRSVRLMASLVLVAASFVGLAASPAQASITVDETTDEDNTDGDCSLREAIESLNTGSAQDACGSTTGPITIPAGTYEVASDIEVDVSMVVQGAGAGSTILDSDGSVGEVFNVDEANAFTLEGVSIVGGASYSVNKTCGNAGTVTINDSEFEGSGSYGINGCDGPIVVNRSVIDGSGSYGINNSSGSITVNGSVIDGSGSYGINNSSGNVALTDSAILNSGSYGLNTSGGSSTLIRSTVANSGDYGINASSGDVTLTNSTLSGAGSYGINTSSGVITLESSTVVAEAESHVLNSGETAEITNSIVAAGAAGTCNLDVTSGGFNISNDASCGFDETTDLENTDPDLGALADNGGATPTHLPNDTSPAIDSGGDCPSEDQRSEPRPADGDDDGTEVCDRGAVEIQPPAPPTTTTTAPEGGASTTTTAPAGVAAVTPAVPRFTG